MGNKELKYIPLSVPNLNGNELDYVTDAIRTEWVSTAGGYVDRFEQAIANYVQVPKAAAVQSGTAGLHLSLICCGVKPGDEVIVPTLTFIAAVNPVRYVGAHPVFLDCDNTLCLDPAKLMRFCEEECVFRDGFLVDRATERPVTAVVVVHVFGNMAHMEAIVDVARHYNLKVIEDATEALGTYQMVGRFGGKFAGTIGDVGVYSFNGNKIVTCGGGGAIVSDNESIVEHAKHLSTQAKADTLRFVHDEIGYNYRMTNVQAAIGLAQIEQLEGFIKTKRFNYDLYRELGIELLPFREDVRSNRWFFNMLSRDKEALISHLREQSIQARPIWRLIHSLPIYAADRAYEIDKAGYYFNKAVSLPCSTNLTAADVERVANDVKEFEG